MKWGILGAARIAGKALIPAIREAGGEVVAVGASRLERAEAFAREHRIPRALEGYAAVLADPAVEAVYVPLSNGLHKEWAIRCAEAGRACLCEKPMVMSRADAEEIRAAFSRAGRPLQEAFMWRHHSQIEWTLARARAGDFGRVVQIHGQFSFTLDRPDDYRWIASQGGGALLDIGVYCVNAARLFMGCEPREVSARARVRPGPEGVDESTSGWLDFGEGRFATFDCSFVAAYAQGVELICEKARVWIGAPWLQGGRASKIVIDWNDGANTREKKDFPAENAYRRMVENFERAARAGGAPGATLAPGEDGVAQAAAMEALLASSRERSGAPTPVASAPVSGGPA